MARIKNDVLVSNHGNIFLFHLLTDEARNWVAENVSDEVQYVGNALVCEHRYAPDLAAGMQESGLHVA